jgi:hypothetical protein
MLHMINQELPTVAATAAPAVPPILEESSAAETLYGTAFSVAKVFKSVSCVLGSDLPQGKRDLQTFECVLPELSTVLCNIITLEAESMMLRQQLPNTNAAQSTFYSPAGGTARTGYRISSSSSRGDLTGVGGFVAASGASGRRGSNTGSISDTGCTASIRRVKKAHRQLPDCIAGLLQTQGVDSRAVVWVAAAFMDFMHLGTLKVSAAAFRNLVNWIASRAPGLQHDTQQQMQQMQQQMLLVSSVLLQWAAGASRAAGDPRQVQLCSDISDIGRELIQAWLTLTEHPFAPAAESLWLPGTKPAQWLQQVVPNIQGVLAALLEVCRLPAGTCLSAMTANSTAGTTPSLTATGSPESIMFWVRERALVLTQLLLDLLWISASSSRNTPAAAGTPSTHAQLAWELQEAHAAAQAAKAARVHATRMLRMHATRMRVAARAHAAAQRGTNAASSSAAAVTGSSATTAERAAAASGLGCGDIKQLQDQGLDTAGTAEQNSSTTQTQAAAAAEHISSVPSECPARVLQLPPGLASIRGVTVQIISCFESFVRAAAAGLPDGSLEHCGPTLQNPDSGWDPEQCRACVMTQSIGGVVARAHLINGKVRWTPGPLLALVRAAGSSSIEQRQMYSLLRSMVKLSKALCGHDHADNASHVYHVAASAAHLLLTSVSHGVVEQTSAPPTPAANQCSQKQAGLPGSEPYANHQAAGITAAGVTDATNQQLLPAVLQVPSLVLLGHFWDCLILDPGVNLSATHPEPIPCILVKFVLGWLDVPQHAVQLSAAGYDVLGVLTILHGHKETAAGVKHSGDPQVGAEQLLEQLRAAGAALTCLPTHVMCNNPGCRNVSGHSELQLVTGPSSQCGGCRTAHYCSRACQQEHWKHHKTVCRALAAAEGPTAAAAGRARLQPG